MIFKCQVNALTQVPEGMVAKIVPAASYAVFPAVGEYPKSLIETWQKIWQTDVKRTYTGDYEVYGKDFFAGSPKKVDIYIATEKKAQMDGYGQRIDKN